jgi:hypothetical protein
MEKKYKINDIDYICEFRLTNADGDEFEFPKSVVRGMVIEDNFFEPFMSGSITLANPYDLVEDKYSFRGDGRDYLKIKFYPEKEGDDNFDEEFVVVGDDNYINPLTRAENHRSLQLVHRDAIPFMEKIPHGKKYFGKVGNILKYIFEKEMNLQVGEWEAGNFSITYIPPLNYRYLDVVYYLLKIYYAEKDGNYFKGFINYDQKKKKYEMKLICDIFSENKKNTIEGFTIGDFANTPEAHNPSNPPPDAKVSEYFGQLKNISYTTPMYGWNNNHFLNRLIFAYDPVSGVQKIKKIILKDFVSKWEQKFVTCFSCVGGSPKPFIMTNDSNEKKFKHFKTPYLMENSEKIVEADFFNVLTFYNLQTTFNNVGTLQRYSGKFLDVIKIGDEQQKHDKKMLGRWFITSVRHNFLGDGYTNDFVCSKTYVGPDVNIK